MSPSYRISFRGDLPTVGPLADPWHREAREALAAVLRRHVDKGVGREVLATAVAHLEQARVDLGISGLLDEGLLALATRRKPLRATERDLAMILLGEGQNVTALPRSNVGKSPDAAVGALLTDFKTITTGNPRTLWRRVMDGARQADIVMIDVRRSPLDQGEVFAASDRALADVAGPLAVRVVGHGYGEVRRRP